MNDELYNDEEELKETLEEAEEDEVSKSLPKAPMNKAYPKFQYSIFLKNGRDEQLVIRADTFDDLIEAKKDIDKILDKRVEKPYIPDIIPEGKTHKCNMCGGTRKMVEGVKNGKRWAGWFCDNEVSHCPVDWVNLASKK